jgi:hypothetical protein
VAVLEFLMSESVSEPVRLRAAVEILERAGIRGGVEIGPLPQEESPIVVLEQRLATLTRRLTEAQALGTEPGWQAKAAEPDDHPPVPGG